MMVTPVRPPLVATHIRERIRSGSSLPVVVDTDDGPYFVKLRGTAQGPGALVAEVIAATIAEAIDLPVLPWRIVQLYADTPTDDHNDELADLLARSIGDNLGVPFIRNARLMNADELAVVDEDLAARIVWLDWLIMNPDRSPGNPNILVKGDHFWLIDHGAALPFQYNWTAVSEDAPALPRPVIPHAVRERATEIEAWSEILTACVTRDVIHDAVSRVPDTFLRPLLAEGATDETVRRRRIAYEVYLWKRLKAGIR